MKTFKQCLAMLLTLATLLSVACIPASAASYYVTLPADGDYVITPASHSNSAIDVTGGGDAASGTFVQLYEKNGTDAQIFTLKRMDGDWYTITHRRTGLCLNIQSGDSRNDARIWLWSYDQTDACYFRFLDAGNGRVIIQNKIGSQRLVDLDNNRNHNGSIIHLWDMHDGDSGKWKLNPVSSNSSNPLSSFLSTSSSSGYSVTYPNNGDYVLSPASHSNFAIDVTGGGSAPAGTFVQLYEKNGTDAQIFTLTRRENGWYTLTHKRTGLVLNIQSGESKNDARIWLWNYDQSDACYFRFLDAGNGRVIIQNKIGDQRLIDLDDNRNYNGSIIHLWDMHNGDSGKWKLVPVLSVSSSSNSTPATNNTPNTSTSVPSFSDSRYCSAYTLSTSGRLYAYTDRSLSARTGGYIDCASDECRILEVTASAVRVSYPVSSGRRTAWFARDAFTATNLTSGCRTAVASANFTTYRRSSGTSYGSVYKGDTVYILNSVGAKTQIIYPVGNRYKMAFANTSDVERCLGGSSGSNSSSNNTTTTQPASANYASYNGVNYRAQTSDTRRIAALDKAVQMATVLWTAPSTFPTWKSSGGVYNTVTAVDGTSGTEFVAGKLYQGIPYSMAGRTYDDVKWLSLIQSNPSSSAMTGTYYSSKSYTTKYGIDCSYLVSTALNAGCGTSINLNTSGMLSSSKFRKISFSELQPADIFLKSGHVMLFVGMTSNGNYAIIEANASYSRVVYREVSRSALNAYGCYRYTSF